MVAPPDPPLARIGHSPHGRLDRWRARGRRRCKPTVRRLAAACTRCPPTHVHGAQRGGGGGGAGGVCVRTRQPAHHPPDDVCPRAAQVAALPPHLTPTCRPRRCHVGAAAVVAPGVCEQQRRPTATLVCSSRRPPAAAAAEGRGRGGRGKGGTHIPPRLYRPPIVRCCRLTPPGPPLPPLWPLPSPLPSHPPLRSPPLRSPLLPSPLEAPPNWGGPPLNRRLRAL